MRPNAWKDFLLGAEPGPWDARLGAMWKRVVAECGAADKLAAEHGIVWEELPHETKICLAVDTHHGEILDIAEAALRTRIEDWQREARYARIHRSMPEDLAGLVPADVGTLRAGLLTPKDFRTSDYSGKQLRMERLVRALTGTAAYLAAAHMIPAGLALDVVTTAPLDTETLAALRLPAPWSLVVHEPVTLAAAQADDTELTRLIEAGQCAGHQPAILGGLLAASDDGSLDTTAGFLLLTVLDGSGRRVWMLQHTAYGDHAGGRVLHGYAAQLAFARWLQPPTLPDLGPSSRSDSRSALARVVRSEAGQGGGWHHVRVLDFTPPSDDPPPERTEPTGTGTPLTTGTWRRAHWKPGVRIGVRDMSGRIIGPVYKSGAIEGVTFTRQPRFFPRTRIRPDLPLARTTTVYRPPH
ncbi:hypothetical protein ACF07Y_38820 [Streptomyces sp. NPDC016566]|uniref:hypothetical protein n=1 Tax=Streptomyces sp. NPDC016566 TaxID=3364967 RepID=UPI003701222C